MSKFDGFRPRQDLENYTGVPNEVFDEIMSELNGSEFKILCAIFRKTYGWVEGADENGNPVYKTEDNIAQSQLMEIVGVSRNTIKKNLKSLINKNLVVKVEEHEKGVNKPAKYRIKQRVSNSDSRNGERVSNSDSRRVSKIDSTKESNKKNKNNIYKLWQKILRTTPKQPEKLMSYEDDLPISVLEEALERTKKHCDNRRWYYRYFKGIVDNWIDQGVTNMEDVKKLDREYKDKLNGRVEVNPGGSNISDDEIAERYGLEVP